MGPTRLRPWRNVLVTVAIAVMVPAIQSLPEPVPAGAEVPSGTVASEGLPSTSPEQGLAVRLVPLEPIRVRGYKTAGFRLEVRSEPASSITNRLISKRFSQEASEFTTLAEDGALPDIYTGTYAMFPKAQLVTASHGLFSALVPGEETFQGMAFDGVFISVTIDRLAKRTVRIQDVVSRRGLTTLSRIATKRITSQSCFRGAAGGLGPDYSNFPSFALLPSGLVLGFDDEWLACAACGSVRTTISYSQLWRALTPLGRRLAREAAWARWPEK